VFIDSAVGGRWGALHYILGRQSRIYVPAKRRDPAGQRWAKLARRTEHKLIGSYGDALLVEPFESENLRRTPGPRIPCSLARMLSRASHTGCIPRAPLTSAEKGDPNALGNLREPGTPARRYRYLGLRQMGPIEETVSGLKRRGGPLQPGGGESGLRGV
jgi:hypothetical protein